MTAADPSCRTEFPDFTLDVEIPDGFTDVSWRNDACPVWLDEEMQVFLHIDYAAAAEREHPEIQRFMLSHAEDGMVTDREPILLSDDWAEVLGKLDELRAERSAAPGA